MKQMDESNILLNILCLEDVLNDAHLINEMLVEAGYLVSMDIASGENEYLSFLKNRNYDIILADYTLPGFDIYTALKMALELQPLVPFICVSGTIGEDTVVDLLKKGATDYIHKDRLGRLAFAVRRALEGVRKQKEWKKTEEALKQANSELQNLHDNLDQAVFSVDLIHNKMLQVSIAHETVFGYSQEAFFNNPMLWYEMIVPEDKPIVDVGYSVLFSGKNLQHEYRIVHADGQIRWIEAKMKPTLDTNGKLIRVDGIASDITGRKRAEETLRESELKFRNYIDYAPHGVFVADEMGNYVDVNTAASSITGYSKDELLSMKLFELIPEESMEFSARHFEKVVRDGFATGESPFIKKDRSIGYWSVEAVKLSDQRFLGFVVDVTKRKQAEEVLRESKVKYQEIFESTGTATFIGDENAIILMANNECYSITGYTPTEIIGHKWSQYFAPESLQEMLKNHQLRRKNPDLAPKKYEVKLVNKKGEKRDVILNVGMISGTKQSIVSILDITERKRAEQAILQSEENFHRSISESPLGIRIVSADGKTIYANKAFLDIYKINSVEELTSIPAINRYTPESYAQHQERKEKRKNGHEAFDYEISIVRENAEIRHVKVSRKEVLWNGNKHYQVINIDITEQKKLTLDLIAAKEKAEESDRLKSAFLANMSHEIRTPMNGILGFAELLKEPKLTDKEQQEYISIIKKSGVQMLNTINDIVDISKIESGQMEVYISETNVNEQTEYIYAFFKPETDQKGLQFFLKNTLPVKEAIIKTDPEKVYAILTNLVKNAIKFTHKGSIEFGYNLKPTEPVELEFFVKDTGIGIRQEHKKFIFDRFRQGNESLTRNYEGSGLGLSISKAFVKMLGGKIWVESEEGKGSVFYFTIPYNVEPEEKNVIKNVVSADRAENQIKDLKILIAEDDEGSEKLITMAAKIFGKEVLKARTGVEAIEACRNNPDIDLVLMDIKMPEMDGYEATRQIRQFNKDVVIIAQTAYALTGDREMAIEAGCNDYISKPIKKAELMALIQKYFNK